MLFHSKNFRFFLFCCLATVIIGTQNTTHKDDATDSSENATVPDDPLVRLFDSDAGRFFALRRVRRFHKSSPSDEKSQPAPLKLSFASLKAALENAVQINEFKLPKSLQDFPQARTFSPIDASTTTNTPNTTTTTTSSTSPSTSPLTSISTSTSTSTSPSPSISPSPSRSASTSPLTSISTSPLISPSPSPSPSTSPLTSISISTSTSTSPSILSSPSPSPSNSTWTLSSITPSTRTPGQPENVELPNGANDVDTEYVEFSEIAQIESNKNEASTDGFEDSGALRPLSERDNEFLVASNPAEVVSDNSPTTAFPLSTPPPAPTTSSSTRIILPSTTPFTETQRHSTTTSDFFGINDDPSSTSRSLITTMTSSDPPAIDDTTKLSIAESSNSAPDGIETRVQRNSAVGTGSSNDPENGVDADLDGKDLDRPTTTAVTRQPHAKFTRATPLQENGDGRDRLVPSPSPNPAIWHDANTWQPSLEWPTVAVSNPRWNHVEKNLIKVFDAYERGPPPTLPDDFLLAKRNNPNPNLGQTYGLNLVPDLPNPPQPYGGTPASQTDFGGGVQPTGHFGVPTRQTGTAGGYGSGHSSYIKRRWQSNRLPRAQTTVRTTSTTTQSITQPPTTTTTGVVSLADRLIPSWSPWSRWSPCQTNGLRRRRRFCADDGGFGRPLGIIHCGLEGRVYDVQRC